MALLARKSRNSIPDVNQNPRPPGERTIQRAKVSPTQTKLANIVASRTPTTQPTPYTPPKVTAPQMQSATVAPGELFKQSSFTPTQGQTDPRDASYWANVSRLMFTSQQEYNRNLLEGSYANTDYARSLAQFQTDRERSALDFGESREDLAASGKGLDLSAEGVGAQAQGLDLSRERLGVLNKRNQRSLGEEAMRGGLSSSGWRDRSTGELEEDYQYSLSDLDIQRGGISRALKDIGLSRESLGRSKDRLGRAETEMTQDYATHYGDFELTKMRNDAAREAANAAILQGYSIDEAAELAEAAARQAEAQAQGAREGAPSYDQGDTDAINRALDRALRGRKGKR